MEILILVIVGVVSLFLGFLITSTVLRKKVEKKSENFIRDAREKGEVIKKDKILQAKEKFLQLKSEHEKFIQEKNVVIHQSENRLKQKESVLNQNLNKKKRPTIRKFLIVQKEGKREVSRNIEHYNLDVIISVGCRVKSKQRDTISYLGKQNTQGISCARFCH